MKDLLFLEGVTERDIDLLILEELHVSPLFGLWLAAEVFGAAAREWRFRNAWHSVTDPSLGETDLLVAYEVPDDTVSAVLLENKIDAPPQLDQALRYFKRGKDGVKRGRWHRFKTAIVAPSRYLERGGEATDYGARVSYESISQWLKQNGQDARRSSYKVKLLQMAISQEGRGRNPVIDARVTRFYRAYWECASSEFPELAMKEPIEKTANSNWVGFHPSGIPKNRQIYHKMDIGRVDLEIAGAAASAERWQAELKHYLASDTTIVKAGKSAAVRIPVPRLDLLAPFEEQIDKARTGMRAAYRLCYQSRLIGGA